MSIEAMNWVLTQSPTSGDDKVVLLGIANHDGDGGAWPAIATLATYARKSERTVQRILQRLAEGGHIVIHVHGGGTRDSRNDRRPNRYEILRGDNSCHPVPGDGVTDPANGVTESVERGDNSCRVNRPSEPPSEPPLFASDPGDANLNVSFEDLWKGYPRKEDKKAARAVWAAMKPVDRRAAAVALPAWVGSHDAKFAPYLCRWLRNRRWEDETAPKVNGHRTTTAVADRATISELADMVLNYRHRGMELFVAKHGPFPERLWPLYESTYPDPVYRLPVAPDGTVAS
jgi:hypothetical protein